MRYRNTTAFLLGMFVVMTASCLTSISDAVAQSQNIYTDATPARDAQTYSTDVKLINSCIEAGQTKEQCLCVTKIHKYESTIGQYRAAAENYSLARVQRANGASNVSKASHQKPEITAIDNFAERCTVADAYFDARQG